MGNTQQFTTISEQIEILKKRHLSFDDIYTSRLLLSTYGYYNIINGYKEHYVYSDNNEEFYRDGVTFEQIYSLFCLDHSIRNQTMLIMLDLEEHLRAVTSYVIGNAFGSNQSDYLRFNNYQNRNVSPRFSLSKILDIMNKATLSDKDPIRYHRETYGNVPPWVLFKGIYMGTLVNFVRLQKPAQKEAIISAFYNVPVELVDAYLKDLFMDTLFMCYEYRNLAAHGGRIYNHTPDTKIRITPESIAALENKITNFSILQNTHSLGTLACVFDLFDKKSYRDNLRQIIQSEIVKHCINYPDDMSYLMESTGISNIAHPIHK